MLQLRKTLINLHKNFGKRFSLCLFLQSVVCNAGAVYARQMLSW